MEFVSFSIAGVPTWGIRSGDSIRAVPETFASLYPDLRSAIAADVLAAAAEAAADGQVCSPGAITFLPVITDPAKIICIGMNYLAHIREMGREPPEYPALFIRFPDSLVGHDCNVVRPRVSTHYDFEGELAVVIGRPARCVPESDALEFVAGYTCFMDGSVRDFQMQTTQFTAGKNFPASGALGPALVTSEQIPDPDVLCLETRVSGEVMQRGEISDLCIGVREMIAYVSTITQLSPGDVIATGTPSGVGAARNPPRWLVPGDTIEVDIDGLGVLRSTVVDESA